MSTTSSELSNMLGDEISNERHQHKDRNMELYQELSEDSQRYIDMMYCDGFSAFAELQLAGFISAVEFNEALDMIAGTTNSVDKYERLCEFRHMLTALYLAVSDEL